MSSSSLLSTSIPTSTPTSAAIPTPSIVTSTSESSASASASTSSMSPSTLTSSSPSTSASTSTPALAPTFGPITTVFIGEEDKINFKSPLWHAMNADTPDFPLVRQLIADGGTLTPREWEVLAEYADVDSLATAFECGLRPDARTMRMMLQIAGGYDETALPDPEAARDMCAILLPHNTSASNVLVAISCARSRFKVRYNTPREEWPDHLRMLVDWCHDHDVPEKHIQWVERDAAGIPQPDPEFD